MAGPARSATGRRSRARWPGGAGGRFEHRIGHAPRNEPGRLVERFNRTAAALEEAGRHGRALVDELASSSEEPQGSAVQMEQSIAELEVAQQQIQELNRELTAANERLRDSEARLHLALEAGRMGIWVWRLDTNAVAWSPGLEAIHGMPIGSFPGTFDSFLANVHSDDRERVTRLIGEAVADRRPHEIEYRIVLPDGTVRWVEGRGRVLRDATGQVTGMTGVCADATERKRAEIALRASEEQFRSLSTCSADGIFVTDTEGRCLYTNPTCRAICGFTEAEALGDGWAGFIHADDRDRIFTAWREAARTGRTFSAEFSFVRPSGEVRLVEVRAAPVRSDEGTVTGHVGTVEDVTERRRAEEALRQRNEFIQTITDNATVALFLMDGRQHCTFMNPAAEAMTGFALAEVHGRPLHDVVHHTRPDGRHYPISECSIDRVLPRNDGQQGEEVLVRKDGTFYAVAYTASPIRENGVPVGAVIEMRDITAEKRAEAERTDLLARETAAREEAEVARRRAAFLAEVSAALATSLDYETTLASVARFAVPELADYCIVDLLEADGSIRRVAVVHADPARAGLARRLQRFAPDPRGAHPMLVVLRTGRPALLAQDPDAWMSGVHLDAEYLDTVRQLGARSNIIVPLVARDRVLGCLTFALSESGRRFGPDDVGLAEEVGRRAALAVDNARLYQEAQDAVRSREIFLARASHELRTPLTSALGSIRLLPRAMAGDLKEPPATLVETARRNLEAMLALINDLLDASKLASGQEPLALQPTDVSAVVRESVQVVGAQARDKGVRLETSVPDHLHVTADPVKLEQVLVNLLANAITFTPGGGVVTLQAEAASAEVSLRVHDTGEGIAREHLEAIFEPFYQVGRKGRRRPRGTGLGLAICRQIVALHGGRIWAESEGPGRGSTFVVRLPGRSPDQRAA